MKLSLIKLQSKAVVLSLTAVLIMTLFISCADTKPINTSEAGSADESAISDYESDESENRQSGERSPEASEPGFEIVKTYNGGELYLVKNNFGMFAVSDKDYHLLLDFNYTEIKRVNTDDFSTVNFICFINDTSFNFITFDGDGIVSNQAYTITDTFDGGRLIAAANADYQWGLIDVDGNILIEFKCQTIKIWGEKRIVATHKGDRTIRLIDFDGNDIIEPDTFYVKALLDGFGAFYKKNKETVSYKIFDYNGVSLYENELSSVNKCEYLANTLTVSMDNVYYLFTYTAKNGVSIVKREVPQYEDKLTEMFDSFMECMKNKDMEGFKKLLCAEMYAEYEKWVNHDPSTVFNYEYSIHDMVYVMQREGQHFTPLQVIMIHNYPLTEGISHILFYLMVPGTGRMDDIDIAFDCSDPENIRIICFDGHYQPVEFID